MTDAERKRRQRAWQRSHRERQRNGETVYAIDADDVSVPEWLVRLGVLDKSETDDKPKVARALGAVINSLSCMTSAKGT